MPGYVFLSNSSKPSPEEQNSRDSVALTNVSRPCLKIAMEMGYTVYFGINRADPENLQCELPVRLYDSHAYRSILNFRDNCIAYKNLMHILNSDDIEVIHCNTPVGGMIGRICGRRKKIKHIIYTAHGFHFYKDAPLFNRTVLKWAEQIMAHWTDSIITMNQEDYKAAQKFRLKKGGKVFLVHGVGITLSEYIGISTKRDAKRKELNFKLDDVVLISMGDLVARKNYTTAIQAVAKVKNPHLHYLICGNGPELGNLKQLAESLGVSEQIHFLNFRTDVKELLSAADVFLFTTLQEGLPRSMMEAMASGLPCIASNIRGNVDLLKDGVGGFLCEPDDITGFADAIECLSKDVNLRKDFSLANLERIKEFDTSIVEKELVQIYSKILL